MSQHPELTPSPYAAQYTTQSLLCVPLRMGDRGAVARAAEWAMRTPAPSAFATALSLSIFLSAGAGGEPVERALATLAAAQDEDGGWSFNWRAWNPATTIAWRGFATATFW